MKTRLRAGIGMGLALACGVVMPAFGQATDNCAQAPTVGPGVYAFDTTSATATPDIVVSCAGTQTPTNADVWLRYVCPGNGAVFFRTCGLTTLDTVITLYSACGGTEVDCSDDGCDLQSLIVRTMTENETLLVRISGYGAQLGSGQIEITAPGQGGWAEGSTDTGDLPATAQVPQGTGALPVIVGHLAADGDVDMYRIRICDRQAFRASTVDGTAMDTMMALFTLDGHGVTFSDDDPSVGLASTITNQFVTSDGEYYLALSTYNHRALGASGGDIWLEEDFEAERQPDGPAAAEPIASWAGETFDEGDYLITLAGVCFPGGTTTCPADTDDGTRTGASDGAVTIDDLVYFLISFEDGGLDADLDNGTGTGTQDGAVTIDDLVFFLIHFEEGC